MVVSGRGGEALTSNYPLLFPLCSLSVSKIFLLLDVVRKAKDNFEYSFKYPDVLVSNFKRSL